MGGCRFVQLRRIIQNNSGSSDELYSAARSCPVLVGNHMVGTGGQKAEPPVVYPMAYQVATQKRGLLRVRSGKDPPDLTTPPPRPVAPDRALGTDHRTSQGATVGPGVAATLAFESRLTCPAHLFVAGSTACLGRSPGRV